MMTVETLFYVFLRTIAYSYFEFICMNALNMNRHERNTCNKMDMYEWQSWAGQVVLVRPKNDETAFTSAWKIKRQQIDAFSLRVAP